MGLDGVMERLAERFTPPTSLSVCTSPYVGAGPRGDRPARMAVTVA